MSVLTAVDNSEDFASVFRKTFSFSLEFDPGNLGVLTASIADQIAASFSSEAYSDR